MKLVFISEEDRATLWRQSLGDELPELEFNEWPGEVGDKASYDYALVWKPPVGELRTFTNLKAILSLGAGVDHLTSDPELPDGVPVVRLVDRCLTQGMTEYVVYWTLHYHRRMGDYARMTARGHWGHYLQSDTEKRRVGILGLGELGGDAAKALAALHFHVMGWSRSEKDIAGVESYHGPDGLNDMLSKSEILVCLLPMTPQTAGIINRETLDRLPQGAFFINCARGGHVVDVDLMAALERDHLGGATLDVFNEEPLPNHHPYWKHPKVIVTPHMASLTVASSAAKYIADTIRAIERGETPAKFVDPGVGY